MAKEDKKQKAEDEILKEVEQEIKDEEKKQEPTKSKLMEAIKKDIAPKKKEEKPRPKEEKPKGKGKSKKKLPIDLRGAMDALKGAKEARKAAKEKPKGQAPAKLYTITLKPRGSRHNQAVNAMSDIRKFAGKHSKSDKIAISDRLNKAIWAHGKQKPPRRLRLSMHEEEAEEGTKTVVDLK